MGEKSRTPTTIAPINRKKIAAKRKYAARNFSGESR